MPFIEAGDRSYLCAGNSIVIKHFPFISSVFSQDQTTLDDLKLMHKRQNHMIIHGDVFGELTVNGNVRKKTHLLGIVHFRKIGT